VVFPNLSPSSFALIYFLNTPNCRFLINPCYPWHPWLLRITPKIELHSTFDVERSMFDVLDMDIPSKDL